MLKIAHFVSSIGVFMRKLLVAALVLTSTSLFAQSEIKGSKCLDILTDGHRRDSQNFTLNLNDYDAPDFGRDYLAQAIFVVKNLIQKEGCSRQDINFGKGPLGKSHSRCKFIQPGMHNSLACYIETNLGYFQVSYDYLGTANVFFSRWD